MQLLRSFLFTAFFLLFTFCYAIFFAIASVFLPWRSRYALANTWGRVLLPPQVWVLKRELTWIPFIGWGVRQLHAIAINRGAGSAAVRQMIEQGRDRLAHGQWIAVFPEGTRMPPGETRRYGVGGAAVASETGARIVPVAHNAGYFWPRRGLLKQPGTIRVVIGAPIETRGRDPREINEEAQRFIEANSGPPAA